MQEAYMDMDLWLACLVRVLCIYSHSSLSVFLKEHYRTRIPSCLFPFTDFLTHTQTQPLLSPAHAFGPADLPLVLLSVSSHPGDTVAR